MRRLAGAVAALLMVSPLAGQDGPAERPVPELPAGVRLEATTEYYDVEGGDLPAVITTLNRMRLEGPSGPPSQGLTQYWIAPDWSARASGGECRVSRVRVDVEIRITLPRWPGASSRPAEERARWREIEGAIREHEYVHRDLTIEAAGELLEEIDGLAARGCGTLRTVVTSTLSVVHGRLREAHAALDRDTPPRLSIGPPGR